MVSVADEIERKSRYKLAQEREVAARKELRHLQRQLGQTKKAKDLEVHEMTEMIAHLKDQLQEMKSKSNLESKYVKKSAVNSLDMNSTLKRVEETDLGVGPVIRKQILKQQFYRINSNKWKKKSKWKIAHTPM